MTNPSRNIALRAVVNIEGFVRAHADEFTPDQAANMIGDAIMLRRYTEHGVEDEATAKATYLPVSRSPLGEALFQVLEHG